MKLKLLYTATAVLVAHLTTAQVLYTEDFDNLTIGDLSTDPTGATPGQGGWHTRIHYLVANISDVRIATEPSRGKVLLLEHPGGFFGTNEAQKDLDIDWNQRTPLNDVIKVEYDFFTGDEIVNPSSNLPSEEITIFMLNFTNGSNGLVMARYYPYSNIFQFRALNGPQLIKNNWYRLVCYIDYPNNKIHYVIPATGYYEEHVFIPNNTLPVTIDNYTPEFILFRVGGSFPDPTNSRPFMSKYDNITISAVDHVPLSSKDFISSQFNVFPNPVTDVVTITSSSNIGIEELTVYDMNAKIVQSKKIKNESEIQFNMGDIATSSYLLHIKTGESVAIKKIIKK